VFSVSGDVWSAPIEHSRPPRNDSFPLKPQQGVPVYAMLSWPTRVWLVPPFVKADSYVVGSGKLGV